MPARPGFSRAGVAVVVRPCDSDSGSDGPPELTPLAGCAAAGPEEEEESCVALVLVLVVLW